jgi:hypothetical protein
MHYQNGHNQALVCTSALSRFLAATIMTDGTQSSVLILSLLVFHITNGRFKKSHVKYKHAFHTSFKLHD